MNTKQCILIIYSYLRLFTSGTEESLETDLTNDVLGSFVLDSEAIHVIYMHYNGV